MKGIGSVILELVSLIISLSQERRHVNTDQFLHCIYTV